MSTAIARVLAAPGPFVTVYLDTDPEVENAAHHVELRWKNVRRELEEHGAPEPAVDAIETALDGAHTRGRTLAAVANPGGLLHSDHMPEPPARDLWRFGPLPYVVPLLEAEQSRIPH